MNNIPFGCEGTSCPPSSVSPYFVPSCRSGWSIKGGELRAPGNAVRPPSGSALTAAKRLGGEDGGRAGWVLMLQAALGLRDAASSSGRGSEGRGGGAGAGGGGNSRGGPEAALRAMVGAVTAARLAGTILQRADWCRAALMEAELQVGSFAQWDLDGDTMNSLCCGLSEECEKCESLILVCAVS